MKLTVLAATLAAAVAFSACAHGTGSSMPGSASPSQIQSMKTAAEELRDTSTFVAAKHPGYIAETPESLAWHTGISQAGEAPVPGGMFEIENQYSTVSGGQYVTVFAGSRKTDGQGILLTVTRSQDLHTVTAVTEVVAPSAVRIESAAGGQLQLRETQTGRAIAHDISAL